MGAIVGACVSIAANVADGYVPPDGATQAWQPHTGALLFDAWWPAAVILAVEIMARSEWTPGWRWAMVRYVGLTSVAAVAAVVSYRHMSSLLDFYGEDSVTCTWGPITVDGIMVMSTGVLIAAMQRTRRTAVRSRRVWLRHRPVMPWRLVRLLCRPAWRLVRPAWRVLIRGFRWLTGTPAPVPVERTVPHAVPDLEPPPLPPPPPVNGRAASNGHPRRQAKTTAPAYNDEDRRKAIKAYEEGATPAEINLATGIPKRSVERWTAHLRSDAAKR